LSECVFLSRTFFVLCPQRTVIDYVGDRELVACNILYFPDGQYILNDIIGRCQKIAIDDCRRTVNSAHHGRRMMTMVKLLCLCYTFSTCLPVSALERKALVFPGDTWHRATPKSQDIDPARLHEALDYLQANSSGVGTDETVIIRNGYLIWEGPGANAVHEIYSCTKTFTSTVLGLLVTEGALGADDHAVKYLPSLDDQYPEYAKIRLSHLATMTSGYDSVMGDGWKFYKTDRAKHHQHVLSFTTPGPPLFPAGTSFKYHDPAVHILGYVLTRAAGESLEQVFRTRVADPIGIRQLTWSNYGHRDGIPFNNAAGTPGRGQGGVYSSPRDLARYGLLYLNRGNWKGKQILDASFVERATSTQVPAEVGAKYSDLTGRYGFFWWTNGVAADGTRPWPSAPPKTFAARGAGRNFIFAIPEWSLVIVRLSPAPEGRIHTGSVKKGVWEAFFSRLKGAIVGVDRRK
jgi:CubicO group peptidase (beta-lactamase class C family)